MDKFAELGKYEVKIFHVCVSYVFVFPPMQFFHSLIALNYSLSLGFKFVSRIRIYYKKTASKILSQS